MAHGTLQLLQEKDRGRGPRCRQVCTVSTPTPLMHVPGLAAAAVLSGRTPPSGKAASCQAAQQCLQAILGHPARLSFPPRCSSFS